MATESGKGRLRCPAGILAAILVIAAAPVFSRSYGLLLGNLFEAVVPLLYDRLDVFSVELVQWKSEWGYRLHADNSAPIVVGGRTLPAGLGASSFTLLAHSVQHLIFYALVAAGGACYYRSRGWRLALLSVPLLLLLEVLDIPFVLTGSIEDLLLYDLDPAALEDSLRVKWMDFLNNGGRLGLSMAAAWFAAVAAGTERRPVEARR